ncbi:MAG TPA: ParB/RepB/Spo0J family partition protein [Firmicutes bacterium]|nr:ParB/RepB/Spo0J family partition protein [Bacillota bacterium]
MSRQALGKGLRSLIPQVEVVNRNQVSQIEVDKITANPFQPRRYFDTEKLEQLAQSIKEHGVLEPIIVRKTDEGYQVVVGERRWRASMLAGKDTVPAVVKELTDRQMTELALIENLQREDLNAIEEAEGYQVLIEEFSMTQEEVAQSVGKKRSSVANALRLLTLDNKVKEMVASGALSRGHAKVLLGVDSVKLRQQLAEKVVKEGLSVRQLERLVKDRPKKKTEKTRRKDPEVELLQEELQRVLGTKVRLDYHQGKGKIEIEYYSDEELERILDLMRG